MENHNKYPGIDPWITRIVAAEAKKIVVKLGLSKSDFQDIEQDLHITVESALSKAQDVAFEKAVQQIVKNRAIDIMRWHNRECRAARHEAFSMDSSPPASGDSNDNMAQIIDLESLRREHLGLPPSWDKHRAESTDIEEVLASLPDDLHKLAVALDASNGNVIEAARESGMSHKKARLMRIRLQRTIGWLRTRDI
jgi:DNA-directed RNA polymerase specialized sigma24 family protein